MYIPNNTENYILDNIRKYSWCKYILNNMQNKLFLNWNCLVKFNKSTKNE